LHQELPFLAAGGILCFTPLTLYLFWLAMVNRSDRPTIVSGVWDFIALMAGLVGFFICTGIVLTALGLNHHLFRRGGLTDLRHAVTQARLLASLTPITYLLVLLVGIVLSLRARRSSFAIYNVHPQALEETIDETCQRLHIPAQRHGYLWSDGTKPVLDLFIFHIFSHSLLRWRLRDARLGDEVERHLRQIVPNLPAGENTGGPWIMTAAVSCLITTLCCVVLTFAASFNR
jgi:hypothetical protein